MLSGSYFTKPTFLCLVGQGLFGSIPGNAFNYATMYFQVNGLSDTQAAGLSTIFQLACAIGNLLGGAENRGFSSIFGDFRSFFHRLFCRFSIVFELETGKNRVF